MKVIIDRIEGNIAVCEKEDGSFVDIDVKELPADAKQGDVVTIENGTSYVDKEETSERKKNIEDIMKDMWE